MTRLCCVCGGEWDYNHYMYWGFSKLLDIYQVGHRDICEVCGSKANSFINYYGAKKPKDLAALHQFLVSGVLPMRDYHTLMYAGYYAPA